MVKTTTGTGQLSRFFTNYGMLGVLILLCVFFSILTIDDQHPTGTGAAKSLVDELARGERVPGGVIIVVRESEDELKFARALEEKLAEAGDASLATVAGDPATVRGQLTGFSKSAEAFPLIATTQSYAPVVQTITSQFTAFAHTRIVTPPPYRWPTFLLPDNLRNVANQISVIAIVAIGMTLVIITAGIDLSVGSLIALSAVVAAWLIAHLGGTDASAGAMALGCLGGVALCGLVGAFSGAVITRFRVPPFIATLAMMQVAAGLAYIISQGKPVYQIPDSFVALGRGADPFLGIPYAVILMAGLYIVAHIIMSRTTFGRYVYAVGGNMEASRLAGIRVRAVLFSVYALCGLLAGLGGVLMASQLKSGAPTYGLTYELYVIAAVVVGGTSLSGGEGRIFGTLIGAFIIAVIQNGMNLTNVESYTQKVVLGLVILGAVLLDRLKHQSFRRKRPA